MNNCIKKQTKALKCAISGLFNIVKIAKIEQQANGEEGELNEEDLEEVSGGALPFFVIAAALAPVILNAVGFGAFGIAEAARRRRW